MVTSLEYSDHVPVLQLFIHLLATSGQKQVFLGVAGTYCFVVWALFSVFSIFCIMSFGDYTRLHHQETTAKVPPPLNP